MENVVADSAPIRLRRPARLLRLTSDERLVALVRTGDEDAFEALYDRHHPAILGFCRHMLGTREEAEDAVQHTFLAAFRDLARSDKPIDLRPWLFAIARNRCLSMLRARRPHVEIERAEPAIDGLAATVEHREDLRELLADLARLPEDQRAALLLAELGAFDHAGIATVLGCPREKVKALVFQARTSLAASREARATPCEEIREELATASGAALRRGPLRRHLRTCDGCRAFRAEVATQRKLLALALPVVPSVALKASILSGSGGGASTSSGGAAVATGATASAATSGASGGTLGGIAGTVVSTGAGKVAASLVIAGVVASGGALTERLDHRAGASPAWHPARVLPNAGGALPFDAGVAAGRRIAQPRQADGSNPLTPRPAPSATKGGTSPAPAPAKSPAHTRDGGAGGAEPGAGRAPSQRTPARPSPAPAPAPAAGEIRRHGDGPLPTPAPPPQAQGKPPSPPPAHGRGPPATVDPAAGSAPDAPRGKDRSVLAAPTDKAAQTAPASKAAPAGKPPRATTPDGAASSQATSPSVTPDTAANGPSSAPAGSGEPPAAGQSDGSHGQPGAHGG